MPEGKARSLALALIGGFICFSFISLSAKKGEGKKPFWEVTVPEGDSLQYPPDTSGNFAVMNHNAGHETKHRILSPNGELLSSGPGMFKWVSQDGKTGIGNLGIFDFKNGKYISTQTFVSRGARQLRFSPSGKIIAGYPLLEGGDRTMHPALRFYFRESGESKDYSSLLGEEIWRVIWYGKFLNDSQFLLLTHSKDRHDLLLIDVPSGNEVWKSTVPFGPAFSSRILVSEDRVLVREDENELTFQHSLCSYEDGKQRWCKRGNFTEPVLLSNRGIFAVLSISSGQHGTDGTPLFKNWTTRVLNARDGSVIWDGQFLGSPVFIDDEHENLICVGAESVAIVDLKSGKIHRKDLPDRLKHSSMNRWGPFMFYLEASKTIIFRDWKAYVGFPINSD